MKINIGSKNGINNFGSVIIGRQTGAPNGIHNFDSVVIGEQVIPTKYDDAKKAYRRAEEILLEAARKGGAA